MALNLKQSRFVDEYLVDLNATQAAIRAGYSAKTAAQIAEKLLRKAEVQKALSDRIKARERRTEITQDRVLQEYAKLAFLDVRRMYKDDGSLLPIADLDADVAAAIQGMDVAEISADGVVIGVVKKIKLSDKKGALDSVARHLGMFNDKLNVTHTFSDMNDAELEAEIARLHNQVVG